jgi:hypothetical protein
LVTLRTNLFRNDEVRPQQPLSFSSFSIGEEISNASIVDLCWSPPGLAQHLRSGLALLTSNLVLSIWAATDLPPQNPSSWKRVLVINRALQSYFTSLNPGDVRKEGYAHSERLKRLQRIRSFAWAPAAILRADASARRNGVSPRQGTHFLAIANDENEIIILQVASPYDKLQITEKGGWSAIPVSSFKVNGQEESERPNLLWTFEDYVEKESYVSALAWSPWQLQGSSEPANEVGDAETVQDESSQVDTLVSILAYSSEIHIGFRRILFTFDGVNSDVKTEVLDFRINLPHNHSLNGPLLWTPNADKGRITLLVCAYDEVICCSLSLTGNLDPAITRRKREEWDDVAGKIIRTV